MKNIKKLSALLLVVVTASLSLFCCSTVEEKGDVTVVIENEEGEYDAYKVYLEDVENKSEGVVGILEHLNGREDNPLHLKMSDGPYGKFLTEIGSVKEDLAAKKYITVYTSLEKDFGTWEGVGVLDYEGITLKSSGVGISEMSVESGTVILFRSEASQW